MSARGLTRGRPSYSDKEFQHRKKFEKEKKKLKKKKDIKKNYYWVFCAFSAFLMIGGFILPVVDIYFLAPTYTIITVWIFGESFTNILGERINFFYPSTLAFGIILLISGFIKLKLSYDARREKHGNHSKLILISSVIDVLMLIISISLIWSQKSFFTTQVGYSLSLDDVSIVLSLGFYAMLFGAILGFVAVGWDKIFRNRIKEKNTENK